ncbi:MAG TPA: Fur family transcriptional regulator [Casimicrobiaceae bacterium]|nr:Fur family transcriptional regulator [Casimicrobiaceae bacterium]
MAASATSHRAGPRRDATGAQALLASRGARATRARVDVLAVLLATGDALSHHDVERRLPRGHGIDRVTLYRVLEWLTAQGLAHKVASDDRIWRFSAAGRAGDGTHAHFRCSDCGRVICLEHARMPAIPLPEGFRRADVEITVKGTCDACRP